MAMAGHRGKSHRTSPNSCIHGMLHRQCPFSLGLTTVWQVRGVERPLSLGVMNSLSRGDREIFCHPMSKGASPIAGNSESASTGNSGSTIAGNIERSFYRVPSVMGRNVSHCHGFFSEMSNELIVHVLQRAESRFDRTYRIVSYRVSSSIQQKFHPITITIIITFTTTVAIIVVVVITIGIVLPKPFWFIS